MDGSAELGRPRAEGPKSSDRKGSTRQRGEPSGHPGAGASAGRPPQDSRRKRSNEQRYAGWGDGIEHDYCSRAMQFLPATFPVESHAGAATIAASIVARRPNGLLLCTFSHHGPHAWPDGEVVDDAHPERTTTASSP